MVYENELLGQSLIKAGKGVGLLFIIGSTLVLAGITGVAIWQHGIIGVFASVLDSSASLQIFIDLVIMCLLVLIWIRADSRLHSRLFWPWVLLTLVAGAFGPLLYLLFGVLLKKRKID
jgi:hypothetical protein